MDLSTVPTCSCCCGLGISNVYALKGWACHRTVNSGQWRTSVIIQKTTTPIFPAIFGTGGQMVAEMRKCKR